jgi:hypothetical protein
VDEVEEPTLGAVRIQDVLDAVDPLGIVVVGCRRRHDQRRLEVTRHRVQLHPALAGVATEQVHLVRDHRHPA